MTKTSAQPKKKSRNLEKTRSHILDVAFHEIFRRGFQGVSVDEIVSKTGLTKGAFYHHFPTKLDLGYAIADEVLQDVIMNRWIHPIAEYPNPIEGIIKQLKKVIDTTPDEKVMLGCPLNNLSQEMSNVDAVFQEKLLATTQLWIDEIEKILRQAKGDGFLKKSVEPKALAEFVVTLHEGMYAMGKNFKSKRVWYSLYNSLKNYLATVS